MSVTLRLSIAAGAVLAAIGLWLPFATLPTGESPSLYDLNQNFALLVLALVAIAAFLGFTRFARFAFIPSLMAGGVAAYGANTAIARIEQARTELESLIESSPFGVLAGGLLDGFEIHQNWWLVFFGALLSTASSIALFAGADSSKRN